MKSRSRLSREQAFGLSLAALAIVAGLWMAYRFGPRPEKALTLQAATNQPIFAPAPNQESTRPALGADLFSALFNASTSPLASGRAGDPPAKYLESLEAVYRRRGYRRFEAAANGGGDRRSLEKMRSHRVNQMRGKIYWRTEAGSISTIAAWGEDADPHTEDLNANTSNSQKQMYLTAVSPAEGGGSQWTTYRYLADTSELRALHDQLQSSGDWPGQDPFEVPRPSGLRRLISIRYPDNRESNHEGIQKSGQEGGQSSTMMAVYQSQLRAESLAEWYTREMPLAGWSLNSRSTEQVREKMPGVLHFTKGHRSCLVWISSGAGSDQTSVIISARTT
jgi:hypothetical protein